MSDVWTVEAQGIAERTGVNVEALARLVGSGREAPRDEPPFDEAEMMRRLGRLLVSTAEELESIAEAPGRVASARGGLLGLAAVAAVLEVPKLAEWTARLAATDELAGLASDAARMLRGEAFEMVWTQSLIELRACDWRWPERRETRVEPVGAEVVAEPVEEVVEPVPEPEPVATLPEPEAPVPPPVPEPEPEPEPAMEPVVIESAYEAPEPPRRASVTRALVADPSGIAASFLARLLVSRGVEVTVADSAGRVSAQAAQGDFDLVFVAAEWPLTGRGREGSMIVRLIAEGASRRPLPGERVLRKPPAEEEVDLILEAWAGRRIAR